MLRAAAFDVPEVGGRTRGKDVSEVFAAERGESVLGIFAGGPADADGPPITLVSAKGMVKRIDRKTLGEMTRAALS